MEIMQVLHMNKGNGESSYAQNSKLQKKILTIAKPILEEAVVQLLSGSNNPQAMESMGIADLGCSSGPNTLLLISEVMDVIHTQITKGGLLPHSSSLAIEFRVFLNDLFSNDFNSIFVSLPEFYNKLKQDQRLMSGDDNPNSLLISAVPGSFYGRLFARKSLHFVHSSSSLHWLSQVPPSLESKAIMNKGKIYISKSSPQCVMDAYALQFHKDFSMFLKSRAEEVVAGGRMVLSFMGRPTLDPTTEQSCYQWELLALALMSMVSEGLVEEDKVDSFNAPYYAPCAEELKSEVIKDGFFIIDQLEEFEIDWDGGHSANVVDDDNQMVAASSSGKRVAKTVRAVVESMIEAHFGMEIMDDLFRRYAEIVTNHLSKRRTKYVNLVISLIRRD